jgi:hypothetical protein
MTKGDSALGRIEPSMKLGQARQTHYSLCQYLVRTRAALSLQFPRLGPADLPSRELWKRPREETTEKTVFRPVVALDQTMPKAKASTGAQQKPYRRQAADQTPPAQLLT